ncbi:MAG TPA: hypothetical protein VF503_19760 [Sphingobium sp.]|uniref:hypothetical protein n=1 Tax=Sphingobium sp. TaxID=1912891 RepID=UPI002ECFD511
MASYGERGTAGALDHLPSRVQGPRERKRGSSTVTGDVDFKPARRWDNELKTFRRD